MEYWARILFDLISQQDFHLHNIPMNNFHLRRLKIHVVCTLMPFFKTELVAVDLLDLPSSSKLNFPPASFT